MRCRRSWLLDPQILTSPPPTPPLFWKVGHEFWPFRHEFWALHLRTSMINIPGFDGPNSKLRITRPLLLDNLPGPTLHYFLVHLQDPQPFIFLAILYVEISSIRDKNIMTKKNLYDVLISLLVMIGGDGPMGTPLLVVGWGRRDGGWVGCPRLIVIFSLCT